MRVLVTGGSGFIGQRVVTQLRDSLVIDRRHGVPRDVMDLTPDDFRGVDAVVHLSALADVSGNWFGRKAREQLYFDNIDATIALLEAMPPLPIVFASTAAVYGDAPGRPSLETDAPAPTSPYAATKLASEALIQAYAHKHGNPYYLLRLVAAVGPGYTHGHVKDFVRQAREGEIHAKTAGNVRRSAVHVDDVAELVAYLVHAEEDSGVYNVASSEAWSWRDTVDVMREVRPNATFSVHVPAPDVERGWVGDPLVQVSIEKLIYVYHPRRTIRQGVIDALHGLGWSWE